MRKFEKISFEQFKKDIKNDKKLYEEYLKPKRGTVNSAGYDFYAVDEYILRPNEIVLIPTGIKVIMNSDEMLMVVVRSSMGFKYNVRMCNQVGIVESDYYNNINNEGHIFIKLQNHGDKEVVIKKNDRYCQGIFVKFLTVDDEDIIDNLRIGGFGSTDGGK